MMCRAPFYPWGVEGITAGPPTNLRPANRDQTGELALKRATAAIDSIPELKGAGLILRTPGLVDVALRESDHASDVDTYVIAIITGPEGKTWWMKWGDVVLNCGGAVVSTGGLVAAAAGEIPSAGLDTPVTIVEAGVTSAAWGSCGLAVAKSTNENFAEYVETDDGKWVRYTDVILDIIGLADGVGGAVKLLKESDQVLKTTKYVKFLNSGRKGALIKNMEKLEKAGEDLTYLDELLQAAAKENEGVTLARSEWGNNLIRRSLVTVTAKLPYQKLSVLSRQLSDALTLISSTKGGAIHITVNIVQYTIAPGPDSSEDSATHNKKP